MVMSVEGEDERVKSHGGVDKNEAWVSDVKSLNVDKVGEPWLDCLNTLLPSFCVFFTVLQFVSFALLH